MMQMYKITPDSKLSNEKLSSFLTNVHMCLPFNQRFKLDKSKLFNVETSPLVIFEIVFSRKDISFYYSFDERLIKIALNEFNICYPKSAILPCSNYTIDINEAKEFELKNHSFMSLRVDRRGEFPLNSFLESSRMLQDDEKVLLQYILEPTDNIFDTSDLAVSDFENGHLRKKLHFDKVGILKLGGKVVYYTLSEFLNLISILLTNEEIEIENIDKLENEALFKRGLSENTKAKFNYLSYDTSIRIAVESKRPQMVLELFSKALNNVQGDNALTVRKLKKDNLISSIINKTPIDKVYRDSLSTLELSQLLQLPTVAYQQIYPIDNIDISQIIIPEIFTKEGIRIGKAPYRGGQVPINFPLSKNPTQAEIDSLCQCWVSIGKMGTGKTTNGENQAIQLLNNGIAVFAIDVADGKLIDNIEQCLPKTFDKIIDLDFGDTDNPIPLSWTETALVGSDSNIETKLSSQLKNFLNKLAKSETSDRMERFLGAAAKAVYKNPTANLYDVILCLTNDDYRHRIIKENKIEGRIKYTLEQLDDDKTGTKTAYVMGVMDRLDALLDNEYAANCMLQRANPDINFRKWADEGYFVGIRVPKDTLLDDATDLLVTYIVSKLWLAILTRNNIPKEERKPCMLILDEPHQFPSVLSELYSIIREMRKWRLGMIILAHEFGDFKYMQRLLKNAGTNYFIYSTSKETYRDLLEELAPYTLEECLKTKWHHAIVSMRYNDNQLCTMVEMLKPYPKICERHIANVFGRPLLEVQEEILEKEFKN